MIRRDRRRRRSLTEVLRLLTGAREDVLAELPGEKIRHTAMGAVVAGTALMATISMTIALTRVLGDLRLGVVVFAVFWGGLILSLDRWLMSTPAEDQLRKRLGKLVPRAAISVIIGFVVAEPMLLAVFDTAILERIQHDRATDQIKLQSDLVRCNPLPRGGMPEISPPAAGAGIQTPPSQASPTAVSTGIDPGCAKLILSLDGSEVESAYTALAQAQSNVAKLQDQANRDADEYAKLEFDARKECNGTNGPGFSGRRGEGPNCKRLRQQADQFRSDHRIDENKNVINGLNGQITSLMNEAKDAGDKYLGNRRKAIDEELQKAKERQLNPGLLERMQALGALAGASRYAAVMVWSVRLLFVLVDALPVLIKLLSGQTAYDLVAAEQLRRQTEEQEMISRTQALRSRLREESRRHDLGMRYESRRRIEARRIRAEMLLADDQWEQLTEARTRQLLDDSPTLRLPRVPAAPSGGVGFGQSYVPPDPRSAPGDNTFD